MKKLTLIFMICVAFGMMASAQNNVPVCAADTVIRDNGDTLINEVLASVGKIDNKNFIVATLERTRINGIIMTGYTVRNVAVFALDSTYYLFHAGGWHYYTGAIIQDAVAPVSTPLLISLGRNIYYQTEQDSLWIPRTY